MEGKKTSKKKSGGKGRPSKEQKKTEAESKREEGKRRVRTRLGSAPQSSVGLSSDQRGAIRAHKLKGNTTLPVENAEQQPRSKKRSNEAKKVAKGSPWLQKPGNHDNSSPRRHLLQGGKTEVTTVSRARKRGKDEPRKTLQPLKEALLEIIRRGKAGRGEYLLPQPSKLWDLGRTTSLIERGMTQEAINSTRGKRKGKSQALT